MSTVLHAAEREKVESDQTAFNVAVWDKIVSDPDLAGLPYRIETDRHGQIIMSPPAPPSHGNKQGRIAGLLGNQSESGEVITECPISTGKGVKPADVAWCSDAVWRQERENSCMSSAPEICVEVISPSNTSSEIQEKKDLYFEAGAKEVWLCADDGTIRFHHAAKPDAQAAGSGLFPDFPSSIS